MLRLVVFVIDHPIYFYLILVTFEMKIYYLSKVITVLFVAVCTSCNGQT